jgi:hypothetical protein
LVRFAEAALRTLFVSIAAVMISNARAGYAQENPSTPESILRANRATSRRAKR